MALPHQAQRAASCGARHRLEHPGLRPPRLAWQATALLASCQRTVVHYLRVARWSRLAGRSGTISLRVTMQDEIEVSCEPAMVPTHPGELLREDVLPALGLSVSEAARQLGVTRQTLHRILAGTHGITRRWRFGSAGSAAAVQGCGCACNSPTTCGTPNVGFGISSTRSPCTVPPPDRRRASRRGAAPLPAWSQTAFEEASLRRPYGAAPCRNEILRSWP
jgi:hypothetical protein